MFSFFSFLLFAEWHFLVIHSFFQNETSRHNSTLIQAQTIITLSKLVTPQAVHQCLKFLYSGSLDLDYPNLKVSITLQKLTQQQHTEKNQTHTYIRCTWTINKCQLNWIKSIKRCQTPTTSSHRMNAPICLFVYWKVHCSVFIVWLY